MFKHLLLSLDAGKTNQHVIDVGLTFAQRLGACVNVSCVFRDALEEKASGTLLETFLSKAKQREVCAKTFSQRGRQADALRSLVKAQTVDCIVAERNLYSVGLQSDLELPMVLVPSRARWRPGQQFKHLLVFLEDTPESFYALEQANILAQTFGATLSVLHILELPGIPPEGARAWMYANREQVVDEFEALRNQLRHQSRALVFKAHHHTETAPEVEETINVATPKTLKTLALERAADLLVLGNARETWMDTLLRGRLVRVLARDIPVLVFQDLRNNDEGDIT
jgi:nucleotide-binding universal stress UspA family protein